VIASLLDGTMTNCLFLHGHTAVTVELKIRYSQAVETDKSAAVRSRIVRSTLGLHLLEAELIQGGEVKVTASAKFMEEPKLRDAER
jgi:acyl-coenzyme A thioesterase PaaI-like protein